jgi:hypothetical protein
MLVLCGHQSAVRRQGSMLMEFMNLHSGLHFPRRWIARLISRMAGRNSDARPHSTAKPAQPAQADGEVKQGGRSAASQTRSRRR